MHGECSERHTGADFLRFLKAVDRCYRGRELHVILNNSSTHSTPEVRTWLEKHPHVCFHFTPTGASWLNMVEAWFGILLRKLRMLEEESARLKRVVADLTFDRHILQEVLRKIV